MIENRRRLNVLSELLEPNWRFWSLVLILLLSAGALFLFLL